MALCKFTPRSSLSNPDRGGEQAEKAAQARLGLHQRSFYRIGANECIVDRVDGVLSLRNDLVQHMSAHVNMKDCWGRIRISPHKRSKHGSFKKHNSNLERQKAIMKIAKSKYCKSKSLWVLQTTTFELSFEQRGHGGLQYQNRHQSTFSSSKSCRSVTL